MYFELAHCLDGLGQTRQSSIVALKQEKVGCSLGLAQEEISADRKVEKRVRGKANHNRHQEEAAKQKITEHRTAEQSRTGIKQNTAMHCNVAAYVHQAEPKLGLTLAARCIAQPNQVVLGSSKTSRDIERPTSNCSEGKKLLRLITYYFIESTNPAHGHCHSYRDKV